MNAVIANTPNVEGNIGSCTSQSVEVIDGRTFWTENDRTIVTNSCTGEVREFTHWSVTGSGFFSVVGVFIILIVVLTSLGSY